MSAMIVQSTMKFRCSVMRSVKKIVISVIPAVSAPVVKEAVSWRWIILKERPDMQSALMVK